MDMLDLKRKEDALKATGTGQKGWQLMVGKDGKVWRYNVNSNTYEPADLPEGAQKMPPSGKPSMSEEKMSVQYQDMSFNEKTIRELAAKGVTTLPVSTQVWGKMIDPTTGNINASVQKSIRDALSTPEEKMLWDANVGFVIAYAHAISGARLNENQLMVIWNSRVPMSGDSPEEVLYKQKMRENDLQSVIRGTGSLRPELEEAAGIGGHSFATEQDAEAAAKRGEIKSGDRITVGGKSGVWQ